MMKIQPRFLHRKGGRRDCYWGVPPIYLTLFLSQIWMHFGKTPNGLWPLPPLKTMLPYFRKIENQKSATEFVGLESPARDTHFPQLCCLQQSFGSGLLVRTFAILHLVVVVSVSYFCGFSPNWDENDDDNGGEDDDEDEDDLGPWVMKPTDSRQNRWAFLPNHRWQE